MQARKYRTGGHGCVRRGSALERTRLNVDATKTTVVAEISATPVFHRFLCRGRELQSGFIRPQLAAHVQRQKEDDAMTGTAASRLSHIWSSRSSRGWAADQGNTPLPHRPSAAGSCLTRACVGFQPHCVATLFAMAGT
jgi:hypothetical protein